MTTDNRTNEPTPEQAEVALMTFRTALRLTEGDRQSADPVEAMQLRAMRAALVAAQGVGVAPQGPCPQPCEHLSAEDAREGRDCREHPCTCPTSPFFDREKLVEEARAETREGK